MQKTLPPEQTTYQAYLLRLWQSRTAGRGPVAWSASLEDPHTGERLGFATFDHLFAYLLQQTKRSGQPALLNPNFLIKP